MHSFVIKILSHHHHHMSILMLHTIDVVRGMSNSSRNEPVVNIVYSILTFVNQFSHLKILSSLVVIQVRKIYVELFTKSPQGCQFYFFDKDLLKIIVWFSINIYYFPLFLQLYRYDNFRLMFTHPMMNFKVNKWEFYWDIFQGFIIIKNAIMSFWEISLPRRKFFRLNLNLWRKVLRFHYTNINIFFDRITLTEKCFQW